MWCYQPFFADLTPLYESYETASPKGSSNISLLPVLHLTINTKVSPLNLHVVQLSLRLACGMSCLICRFYIIISPYWPSYLCYQPLCRHHPLSSQQNNNGQQNHLQAGQSCHILGPDPLWLWCTHSQVTVGWLVQDSPACPIKKWILSHPLHHLLHQDKKISKTHPNHRVIDHMTRNKGKKETCLAGGISYVQVCDKGWKNKNK